MCSCHAISHQEANNDLSEEIQEKQSLQMMTGRQIAFMIDALFKINNVQKRVIDIDDLLNIEVVHDNLRKFDEAWEITPRAPERESENDLSQGIYHREQKK